jgi:hypothetical protein
MFGYPNDVGRCIQSSIAIEEFALTPSVDEKLARIRSAIGTVACVTEDSGKLRYRERQRTGRP